MIHVSFNDKYLFKRLSTLSLNTKYSKRPDIYPIIVIIAHLRYVHGYLLHTVLI